MHANALLQMLLRCKAFM